MSRLTLGVILSLALLAALAAARVATSNALRLDASERAFHRRRGDEPQRAARLDAQLLARLGIPPGSRFVLTQLPRAKAGVPDRSFLFARLGNLIERQIQHLTQEFVAEAVVAFVRLRIAW